MLRFGLASAFVVVLAGCGENSGPVTAPVSGTVTLDGKPLAGAVVNFGVEGFIGSGKTGSDGTYSLVQGAALGENKVWIKKFVPPEGFSDDAEDGMDEGQLEAMNMDSVDAGETTDTGEKIPADYSDSEKTILKVVVNESGNSSVNFDLKSGN
jgi:hypothetical protein